MELIRQFPHCDARILHAPGECEFCDLFPLWQELRKGWGIAFTGHAPAASLPRCGRRCSWGDGREWRCQQPAGHDREASASLHTPSPAWERLPCPADAARPAGSAADHRRWGGNKPTSAAGDPSWPVDSATSAALYGDQGGRAPWPLPERIRRRLRRPLDDWRKWRRGWRKRGHFWRFP